MKDFAANVRPKLSQLTGAAIVELEQREDGSVPRGRAILASYLSNFKSALKLSCDSGRSSFFLLDFQIQGNVLTAVITGYGVCR